MSEVDKSGAQVSSTPRLSQMVLVPVEPQPRYIASSGRWCWPLPEWARFPGCSTEVVTASREWWEYAPSEAKPHSMAEGVQLRDDRWYWAIPAEPSNRALQKGADVLWNRQFKGTPWEGKVGLINPDSMEEYRALANQVWKAMNEVTRG